MREVGQELHAEIGREHDRHEPARDQSDGDDPEDAAGIFADRGVGEADRQEAGRRHQRAGQHREGGRGPGEGGGARAVPALLHLHDHHLDRDDGVVDEQAERDDQRAERDAVQVEMDDAHDDEGDGEHQRNRQRHHDAGAPAERQEADQEHDAERLGEGFGELADGVVDDMRLVGDLLEVDALRQRGFDLRHRGFDVLAELDDVGALGHDDADAERRLAALMHQVGRRILEAARHRRDVAEAEARAAGFDRRVGDRLDAVDGAGDAQRHALRAGLDGAGRDDGVLLCQRIRRWPAARSRASQAWRG